MKLKKLVILGIITSFLSIGLVLVAYSFLIGQYGISSIKMELVISDKLNTHKIDYPILLRCHFSHD